MKRLASDYTDSNWWHCWHCSIFSLSHVPTTLESPGVQELEMEPGSPDCGPCQLRLPPGILAIDSLELMYLTF